MKKIIYLLFLPILGLLGCQEEIKIRDYAPTVVEISVCDANGVDLLNPQSPEALDVTKIKALYKGEQLDCVKDKHSYVATRALMPRFYGLQVTKDRYAGMYILKFGEFSSTSALDESVTLLWPDGSSDKIDIKTNSERLEILLNDVKMKDPMATIKLIK